MSNNDIGEFFEFCFFHLTIRIYYDRIYRLLSDSLIFRGVAQLVAYVVWDHGAAGSSPVTSTISSVHNGFELWTLDFL